MGVRKCEIVGKSDSVSYCLEVGQWKWGNAGKLVSFEKHGTLFVVGKVSMSTYHPLDSIGFYEFFGWHGCC